MHLLSLFYGDIRIILE